MLLAHVPLSQLSGARDGTEGERSLSPGLALNGGRAQGSDPTRPWLQPLYTVFGRAGSSEVGQIWLCLKTRCATALPQSVT